MQRLAMHASLLHAVCGHGSAHLSRACSAPLPGTTPRMMTPLLLGPSTLAAAASGISIRPSPGRTTRPKRMSWFTTLRTVSDGMQKPMPLHSSPRQPAGIYPILCA